MPPKIQGSKDTGPNVQGSGGARDLYQRTTSKTLNLYKLLKSNVISESKHTIKLKNGSVLRKSAVAEKQKPILPKKRKPATLKEMLSRKKGVVESPKSKRPKAMKKVSVATFQSDSSDSEDYQPLNIIPARLPIEVLARHEAVAAGQGPSGSTAVAEHGTGARVKSRGTKVRRGKGGQKQGKGSQDRPALAARECLMNSSQEEDVESGSQSESSGTRRSTRRRKPVDKMGGVMIDNIQGPEQKGKHPGGEGK